MPDQIIFPSTLLILMGPHHLLTELSHTGGLRQLHRNWDTGMTFTALVLSPHHSAKWHFDPVNVLTDSAGSRRTIPNTTLTFVGQTESQERDVIVKCSDDKVLSVQNQILDNSGQPASGSRYWISIKLGNMWVSLDLVQAFPHCQMALRWKIFWFRNVHVQDFTKDVIYY